MRNLTLHPLWHTAMPVYEHTVGVVTQCLSALAFYLMITKTLPASYPFVKNLMMLQASITLVDLNYGFLSCPITLLPIPGGLCNGILCTWFGFSGHVGVTLMLLSVTLVGFAIVNCFYYKYTTVLRGRSPSKTLHDSAVRVILFVGGMIPFMFHFGRFRALESGSQFVKDNYPSLHYLFEEPKHRAYAYDPRLFSTWSYDIAFAASFICCLSAGSALSIYFLASTFYHLSHQTALSEKTKVLQQRAMLVLLSQTLTPLVVQLAPLLVFIYSISTGSLDPNINNVLLCIQHLHALIHTSILILTTPSYRRACAFWQRKNSSIATLNDNGEVLHFRHAHKGMNS